MFNNQFKIFLLLSFASAFCMFCTNTQHACR